MIAAAIEVHRELGLGFPETVYREAMEIELGLQGISCFFGPVDFFEEDNCLAQ